MYKQKKTYEEERLYFSFNWARLCLLHFYSVNFACVMIYTESRWKRVSSSAF